VLVHRRKRLLRRPFQPGAADFAAPGARDSLTVFGQVERRNDVAMDVDQAARDIRPRYPIRCP